MTNRKGAVLTVRFESEEEADVIRIAAELAARQERDQRERAELPRLSMNQWCLRALREQAKRERDARQADRPVDEGGCDGEAEQTMARTAQGATTQDAASGGEPGAAEPPAAAGVSPAN